MLKLGGLRQAVRMQKRAWAYTPAATATANMLLPAGMDMHPAAVDAVAESARSATKAGAAAFKKGVQRTNVLHPIDASMPSVAVRENPLAGRLRGAFSRPGARGTAYLPNALNTPWAQNLLRPTTTVRAGVHGAERTVTRRAIRAVETPSLLSRIGRGLSQGAQAATRAVL